MNARKDPPPDIEPVLGRLKGFQQAAVEVAFQRLYTAPDSTRRFLIADEVGLGKTLIASGVIARTIHHLWDKVERIDVVYLCSNAGIARQNIQRLNPFPDVDFAQADRITLLPITLKELAKNRLNFVALTPGTSLELKSSGGKAIERILLYWLMDGIWPVAGTGAKNLLQGTISRRDRWRDEIERFPEENDISPELTAAFHAALVSKDRQERDRGLPGLRQRWLESCHRFRYAMARWPKELRAERRDLVGELRALLARACVSELQPDLVILDEFQRFKHLLDPKEGGDAAEIAQTLFSWQNEEAQARVLLLSATPYKMYTLAHEQEEDDHYADFLSTVDFLDPDTGGGQDLRDLLGSYRRELYRLAEGRSDKLAAITRAIEQNLRRLMSRTERIRSGSARDGMIQAIPAHSLTLQASDVRDYVHLQSIADMLEQPGVIEYWRAAPYLLSFMENYRLRERFHEQVEEPDAAIGADFLAQLAASKALLLDPEKASRYEAIDPANPRMRWLLDDVLSDDLWRCLWLPPSLPAYRPEGPFATASKRPGGATKRLVFSAWTVVPKAIAGLLSYEVERRAFTAVETDALNTPEARRRRAALLKFGRTDGRLSGMPVLALLYPSPSLAALGHTATHREGVDLPSLEEILLALEQRIAERLGPELAGRSPVESGPEDDSWYWRAPLLLDKEAFPKSSSAWWQDPDLALAWSSGAPDPAEEDLSDPDLWSEHVEFARSNHLSTTAPGRLPGDLYRVLALLALAGPANAALRALWRVIPESEIDDLNLRRSAGHIAWALRSLFNRPESMAILRAHHAQTPYWQRVLKYAAEGCLDAVLTEHAHVTRDLTGAFDLLPAETAEVIARSMAPALSLRSSRQEYHSVTVRPYAGRGEIKRERHLRGHYAMRFSTEKSDDGDADGAGVRSDVVRDAFNSPFWPFVLATTSVGQEGLDFHAWCHAVVHWNLPSNPVDLEQREGRVHRYKGHAIRKNIALAYGARVRSSDAPDPWAVMFERAVQEQPPGGSGLVPFWMFEQQGGAHIERHVPALPLSKDPLRLTALIKALAVYRMVFGQPRQDDLLAYLFERVPEDVLRDRLDELRVDLSPRSESGA